MSMSIQGGSLRFAAVLALGALSLGGCATKEYVNEQIAIVNTRVDSVDAKAQDGIRRADAAAAAAAAAQSAADAAGTDARNANQRIDQLTGRVDSLEQRSAGRRPRN